MTSATEELRRLLDERGVEWRDESNGYVNVTTFTVGGIEWNAIAKHYINRELDCMRLRSDESITPERVVAATLVSGTSSSEAANPQIRCTDSKRNVPEQSNEDAHTLLPCPFCGGNAKQTTWTPTAASISCIMCGAHFNTYTEAEAISAWNTRAERTCSLIEDGDLLHCSNCGGAAEKQSWARWSYCPNCGRRVTDDRQGD